MQTSGDGATDRHTYNGVVPKGDQPFLVDAIWNEHTDGVCQAILSGLVKVQHNSESIGIAPQSSD